MLNKGVNVKVTGHVIATEDIEPLVRRPVSSGNLESMSIARRTAQIAGWRVDAAMAQGAGTRIGREGLWGLIQWEEGRVSKYSFSSDVYHNSIYAFTHRAALTAPWARVYSS